MEEYMEGQPGADDTVEAPADVSADSSEDVAQGSEDVPADAESPEESAETGDNASVEAQEPETQQEPIEGEQAILQEEAVETYDPSDLIALLETQHTETIQYVQNLQSMMLVSVVIFGVLVGVLVVQTVSGFFRSM